MRRQVLRCQNWPPQGHTVKKPLSWYLNAGCPCLLTSSGTTIGKILPGLSSSVYTECLGGPPSQHWETLNPLSPLNSFAICSQQIAACSFPHGASSLSSPPIPCLREIPFKVGPAFSLCLYFTQESSLLHCAFRNKILSPSKARSAFLPTPAPIATDCLEVMWHWIPATGLPIRIS